MFRGLGFRVEAVSYFRVGGFWRSFPKGSEARDRGLLVLRRFGALGLTSSFRVLGLSLGVLMISGSTIAGTKQPPATPRFYRVLQLLSA